MSVDSYEMQYARFFEEAPAMIWHVRYDGVILRSNHLANVSFGFSDKDVSGKNICELFGSESSKICEDYKKVLETGEAITGSIEMIKSINGHEKWAIVNNIPFKDETGSVIGVGVFAVDITDQKTFENKLRKSSRSLEKANKILKMSSELSRAIIEDDFVDISETMEDLCMKLELNAVFSYKIDDGQAELLASWKEISNLVIPEVIILNENFDAVNEWVIDGKPEWGKPAKLDERVRPMFDGTLGMIVGTAVVVPVELPDDVLCITGFGTVNGRYWSEEEIDALYGLGRLLTILVKSSQRSQAILSRMTMQFDEITSILNRVRTVEEYVEQ